MNAGAILDADGRFFAALLAADTDALAEILADDFEIVDVMAGGVATRAQFLEAMTVGGLRFTEVLRDGNELTVRERPGLGVVVGRTRMTMSLGPNEISVGSRYTHVFVADGAGWRLLAAQGTPIGA